MSMKHHEPSAAEAKMNCKFCGVGLWDGASFCTDCGNVVGAVCSVIACGELGGRPHAKCRMTLVQKMVWGLVAAVAIYGAYVKWGEWCMASVSGYRSQNTAAGSDVSKAEERLQALKRLLAEEDMRKMRELEAAQSQFERQFEEAESLGREFHVKEQK